MKYSQYKFKFYLNANHAIYLGGVLGQNHPHTWELSLDTVKVKNDFVQFDFIEKSVENYFAGFQDADINKIDPFTVTNPTLENLCEFFKNDLAKLLGSHGWLLTRIEMSETPTRSYIIDRTDEIDKLIASEIQADEGSRGISAAADSKLNAILGNHI
jgi:6-pyruvoyltetrahydropterin/6-carboxytetrahydropterin synthase